MASVWKGSRARLGLVGWLETVRRHGVHSECGRGLEREVETDSWDLRPRYEDIETL
jgi:hypothetical protein